MTASQQPASSHEPKPAPDSEATVPETTEPDDETAAVPPAPSRRPATSGTAAAVAAQAAAAHPQHAGIARIVQRLAKGLNTKSGSSLNDVKELARLLYVELGDRANAMSVCQLITELPYDGNPGRWAGIESALAMASAMAAENGEDKLATDYAYKLRAPDRETIDDYRHKLAARVRQRALNEPNLYDREISRAVAAVDKRAELEWRNLRVQTLLFLLAHGCSETLEEEELARLTGDELTLIRALVAGRG